MSNYQKGSRIIERVTIAGAELVAYVKELIKQGNVRRLIIRKPSGDVLVEVPLSVGVAVSGAFTLIAPVLVALGAMAALLAKVQVEIVHRGANDRD